MKPESWSLPGLLTRTSVSSNGPTTVTTFPVKSFSKQVSSSAIVHGDHSTPNPWSYSIATRTNGNLEATYGNADGSFTDYWTGTYESITDNLDDWSYDDVQLAAAQAYSDLVDAIRGSIDVSIDFAQASQTVATPAQMKTILRNAGKIFQNRGVHGRSFITALMKVGGNAWLLWQYGMKPTMQTLYDAVNELAHKYEGFQTEYTGRGAVTRMITKVVPNWPDAGGWSSKSETSSSIRVQYRVTLAIPDNSVTVAARFTSLNPASIAWELMPWSFVIDWFFNVGDYLRNMESAVLYGRYFRGGYRTVTSRAFVVQKAVRDGTPPPGVLWSGTYQAEAEFKSFQRVLLNEMPFPPAPTFQSHLGSGRLLNAAALLTTFLK